MRSLAKPHAPGRGTSAPPRREPLPGRDRPHRRVPPARRCVGPRSCPGKLRPLAPGRYAGRSRSWCVIHSPLPGLFRAPRDAHLTESTHRDSRKILERDPRANQQDRQRLLGGRPDRPDAVRARYGGRAAQGRPQGSGDVPRPGGAGHTPGGRRAATTCRSSRRETKAYLKSGERETAAKFALELQKAKKELAANEEQLQDARGRPTRTTSRRSSTPAAKLAEVREKIQKYDAELKMSSAEAEVAALAQTFNMDVTTDFGQMEQMIQGKIDKNRGKARVAADLSQEGLAAIQAEEKMEKVDGRRSAHAVRGRARAALAGNHQTARLRQGSGTGGGSPRRPTNRPPTIEQRLNP